MNLCNTSIARTTFWYTKNGCGLDGNECQPFNGSSFSFRCPANCAGKQLLDPRTIGAQEIIYQPLVVGSPIYRGDSFICGAAIYAGVVSDFDGGCGLVSRLGSMITFRTQRKMGCLVWHLIRTFRYPSLSQRTPMSLAK
jgi:hypothetical protein